MQSLRLFVFASCDSKPPFSVGILLCSDLGVPVRYVVSESVGDWISLRFGWFDSANLQNVRLVPLVLQEHLGQRLHPLNHRSPESYL